MMDYKNLIDRLSAATLRKNNCYDCQLCKEGITAIEDMSKRVSYSLRRQMELDELHLQVQMVTGFTVEQLLGMFLAGCTISPPQPPYHWLKHWLT